MLTRSDDENLIIVSTAEEYAFLHRLETAEVLKLFKKNNIPALLRSEYDVLRTLDLRDSVSLVECVLERVSA